MADLETAIGVKPSYPYNVARTGPPTLINEFEDGTETRRQKHSNIGKLFTARYAVDRPTLEKILDYFDLKGLLTSFSMVGNDANDAAWGTTTYTVRFAEPPNYDQRGPAPASGGLGYVVTLTFKRLF